MRPNDRSAPPRRRPEGPLVALPVYPAVFLLALLSCLLPARVIGAELDATYIENIVSFRFDGGAMTASVRVRRVVHEEQDILLDNSTLVENADGAVVGRVTVTGVPGAVTLSSSDDRFEVADGLLKLKQGVSADFESQSAIALTITAAAGGVSISRGFQLTVLDVNEAPTAFTVSNNYVPANRAGLRIGQLRVTDPDAGDVHAFEIIGDDRFEIRDGYLALVQGVALEADVDVPVTIMATDLAGHTIRAATAITTVPENKDTVPGPSSIDLLAPDAAGERVEIEPAACEPPVESSPRSLVGEQIVAGPVQINHADAYAIGDQVFIRVVDEDQNLHPLIKDQVDVTVTVTGSEDAETVLLTESGPDTGVFLGYVFTTSRASVPDDCILKAVSNSAINATYTDPTDGQDISTVLVDVAPVGIAFDDETGRPIDGVILTLIDVNTGQPADVRGDGPEFRLFPSAVKSGETVRDKAGNVYENGQGEYRFPAIPDGDYRIEIFNAAGMQISEKPDEELQNLGGASARSLHRSSAGKYALSGASRGQLFHVSQGALPRIDIPIRKVARDPAVTATPSQIAFLQYSDRPGVGTPYNIQQTFCVASQTPRQLAELDDDLIPVPGIVNLIETTSVKAGQPLFIKVTDHDQNMDPAVREKINVQLDIDKVDDREFLELSETEPDSGEFIGYIQSVEQEAVIGNCNLGVVKDAMVRTSYADAFDDADTAEAEVLVDPYGIVFNTRDGTPVNGVAVTLVDADTGEPARVSGDGPAFADYPSTVTTGAGATDAAGNEYEFPPGEYRFPFVPPGNYQLRIANVPQDFVFPSAVPVETIQALPGAPYAIGEGSRGGTFEVPLGPAIKVDIPLDPIDGELLLRKSASKSSTSIGEFIQYKVTIDTLAGSSPGEVIVRDVLPPGFRYIPGSMKIDDAVADDPAMGPRGRELTLSLARVGAGESVELSYVTEVTAGTPPGAATNSVTAVGERIAEANVAETTVFVTEELMRSKSILTGRVLHGPCGTNEGEGLKDVRLYLEDGTNVLTDSDGMWHVEGVNPGTHVLQLDLESLDERYRLLECNGAPRAAGRSYSRFIDVRGGTVWNENFHITDAPPPEAAIDVSQSVSLDGDGVRVGLGVTHDDRVALDKLDLFYRVPRGWQVDEDSIRLNGVPVRAESTMIGLRWPLETTGDHRVELHIRPRAETSEAERQFRNEILDFQPSFGVRSAVLTTQDSRRLRVMLEPFKHRQLEKIAVLGHTDNVPISPQHRNEYEDNYALSRARAAAVAEVVEDVLDPADMEVIGVGPDRPIADNRTRDGRAANRRVELLVSYVAEAEKEQPAGLDEVDLSGPIESAARVLYASAGTQKGVSPYSEVDLRTLIEGRTSVLEDAGRGIAVGSWEEEAVVDDVSNIAGDRMGILSFREGQVVSNSVHSIRVRLDAEYLPRLYVDGEPIARDKIGFIIHGEDGTATYNYIGVNIGKTPGPRQIKLEGIDRDRVVQVEELRTIYRAGEIARIRFVRSEDNVADGKTPVRVRLELLDSSHRVIRSSVDLDLLEGDLVPWTGESQQRQLVVRENLTLNAGGLLTFSPVTRAGVYRVRVGYNEVEEEFNVFVKPETREWILVGLAEGVIGRNDLSGDRLALDAHDVAEDYYEDGRLAFYAKGTIKGEYLLTLAYDSDKRDEELFQHINPGKYYTIYGDASTQNYDAASREKLYLRLDKGAFHAMAGDYSTNLQATELGKYTRSLSGIYSEYYSDRFDYIAFASETTQAYIRDDIRGDGTSGIYRLSRGNILQNSEDIRLEVRDRIQNEEIVTTRALSRGLDYTIDYVDGTVVFKEPVLSQDGEFNPQFIVAEYEVDVGGGDEINFGGRFAAYFDNRKGEVGATLIEERTEGREAELAAVDVTYRINEANELRAEYATSESMNDSGRREGDAWQIEYELRANRLDVDAYVRDYDAGFGIGQQSGVQEGTRQIGADVAYRAGDTVEIRGRALHEDDLQSGRSRDTLETGVEFDWNETDMRVGVRSAVDRNGTGDESVTTQSLIAGAARSFGRLRLRSDLDLDLSPQSENEDYPTRVLLGANYALTDKISLLGQQEFSFGEIEDTQQTRLGLRSELWEGAEAVSTVQREIDDGERLVANYGIKQAIDVGDNWTFDFGLDRAQTLRKTAAAVTPINPNAVPVFEDETDDFTAMYAGAGFDAGDWEAVFRVEHRTTAQEDRSNLTTGVLRRLSGGMMMAGVLDLRSASGINERSDEKRLNLGLAYRPLDRRWVVLNKLDLHFRDEDSADFNTRTKKIVNNVNVNYTWEGGQQVSLQYAFKYVVDTIDEKEYRGFTDLIGSEFRKNLSDRWDLGLSASALHSWESDVIDYSWGLSLGHQLATNTWASLGYNFEGFTDKDFDDADYTAKGVYLKFRFKFDQDSAKQLLKGDNIFD